MTFRTAALVWCLAAAMVRTMAAQGATPPDRQPADRAPNAAKAGSSNATTDAVSNDYVIGADDVLSIVFWRDQQLSGDVLVRPDGKISVPLLDDIAVAGLTPRQLRDRLVVAARGYVAEPVVTVVVKQVNSRKVYITGQVVRPGQYALTASMNVLQLIAMAGGLGDYAKPRSIRVVRFEQGQIVDVHFDYDEQIGKSKHVRSVELKAGDTVVVP